ncbi:prohibitin family protein [Nitrospirillum iridis]|uniref:Regulator of protease activity HflC (Stomatin/prohibitin superfamily) n=1 Tax=Nitrospirillum iridis TaxID=765888 RepID=A0A7X0EG16_9PROT|nr:prohibitin family protein [Nitrospirillum iridis]MBB6254535.1 regulator of protease activity HflC (stomatin/prohibitin superfamily) [Nitrospirillum iridis]
MTELQQTLPPVPPAGLTTRKLRRWLYGLLFVLFGLLIWHSVFIPIESGQLGVLWSRFGGGTVKDHVFGEGYRVIWPWNRMQIYDVRLQDMHGTVETLTADALRVSVDVTARFAPRATDLTTLHQTVGPRYRETVVWPDVVEAVRHVIRQLKPDDLRVLGEVELAGKVDAAAREAIQKHWVDLDRVLITRIALPDRLDAEIQDKLAEEQKLLAYQYILKQAEQQNQKWQIEADGIRQFEEKSHISMLKWRGIEATEQLAASPNTKIVVTGNGGSQIPVLLSGDK